MTVKEIALSAVALLQADDIAELLESDDDSVETDTDVKAIVKSVTSAISELESAGLCKTARDTVCAENGVIPLSALTFSPLKILRVKRCGASVPFDADNSSLKVEPDGNYLVEYRVRSNASALADEVKIGLVEGDIAGYLAARNYCLMTGRTDDAAIWDEAYERCVQEYRLSRRARLPRRAWR